MKNFMFFCKKTQIRWKEDNFRYIISFCTNSTANLLLYDFEGNHNFFLKKNNFFPKKIQFRMFLEISLLHSQFAANS